MAENRRDLSFKLLPSLTNHFLILIAGLVTGIFITLAASYFGIINLNKKQYLYVEMDKLVSLVDLNLKKQNLEPSAFETKLNLAKSKFTDEISKFSQKHNAVIFTTLKPIAGAKNKTDYFTKIVLEGVK